MGAGGLTTSERTRGRTLLTMFQSANSISYLLLSGNIITLYALHLGASSLFIGIMSSFQYASYLFMVAGRELVPRP